MNITIQPGTYIVAVSGGVDSMVLLDLLVEQAKSPKLKVQSRSSQISGFRPSAKDFQLIVAHYDHGIRPDSKADRIFVQRAAKVYGLPFTFDQGYLGPGAGEAESRKARYSFLEAARRATNAQGIVTAHHQDDQLETAFINTLRGTGRRGLTSLSSRPTLLRPLLGHSKSELVAYAEAHDIAWRHDSSNDNNRYTRNHVRHSLLPTLTRDHRNDMLQTLADLTDVNYQIDRKLVNHLHTQSVAGEVDRQWFIMLPHAVASEIMMTWLRAYGINNLDKKRLTMVVAKSKTLGPGKHIVVNSSHVIKVGKDRLALAVAER